jgi:glycosyltransferase involved in cell wall biosynthesis
MRILLDFRFQKGAGPNVTAGYMVDTLVKLNTEHTFVILQHRGQPVPEYPGVQKIYVPTRNMPLEFAWVQTVLPLLMRRYKIDAYHSLKHVGPLLSNTPSLLYVRESAQFFRDGLNAIQWKLPERIYWTRIYTWAMKRSTYVIAISHDTKQVLVDQLGLPDEKVQVVHHGLDPKFRVIDDPQQIRERQQRYNVPEKYILCVSNLWPHKNYDIIVQAFDRLRRQGGRDDLKLVIVGDKSYARPEFWDLIERLGIGGEIVFTDFVKHDDLVYLYNGAELFLYPVSLGAFGNPPLEAMACGCPVVASNRNAIPEVTGGAALLLEDPRDVDEMVATVQKVLDDRALRDTLIQKGFARVQDFSWEKSARRIMDLYAAIASRLQPTGRVPQADASR